jgi:hypothetical protein
MATLSVLCALALIGFGVGGLYLWGLLIQRSVRDL